MMNNVPAPKDCRSDKAEREPEEPRGPDGDRPGIVPAIEEDLLFFKRGMSEEEIFNRLVALQEMVRAGKPGEAASVPEEAPIDPLDREFCEGQTLREYHAECLGEIHRIGGRAWSIKALLPYMRPGDEGADPARGFEFLGFEVISGIECAGFKYEYLLESELVGSPRHSLEERVAWKPVEHAGHEFACIARERKNREALGARIEQSELSDSTPRLGAASKKLRM